MNTTSESKNLDVMVLSTIGILVGWIQEQIDKFICDNLKENLTNIYPHKHFKPENESKESAQVVRLDILIITSLRYCLSDTEPISLNLVRILA